MPTVSNHAFVQGSLQNVDDDGYFLIIQDIILGSAEFGPTTQSPPSSKSRHFGWYKGKGTRYDEDDSFYLH